MRRASLLLLVALCAGCSVVPTGKKWWNPGTWFSASELASKERVERRADKAEADVEALKFKTVHAAHIEFSKAGLVIGLLPETDDSKLAQRFQRNGLGLLAQVDPMSAAESAELFALVSDLRSSDRARVARAEEKQREVEGANSKLSTELENAKRLLAERTEALRKANAKLADAFVRENELADTLRNQRFIMWAAIGGVILFAGLSLYLRIGLGSVGAGLHFLPKLIGDDKAKQVIELLDQKTDWLHQKLVGSGRKKEKAKETLSD